MLFTMRETYEDRDPKPISLASPIDSEYLYSGMRYMIHNEVACLILGKHPAKDDTCHHCKEVGHCKRNCLAYLAELIKKKKQVGTASFSDVFIIELFSFPTKSWVYKTSCGTHISNTKHGLRGTIVNMNLLTRGVVLVHRLVENGFVQSFTDYRISVSKNNVFYFNAIPSNGIYEIDMHDLVSNINSIYNVSTKGAKHNLDSTYLWHRRLAHTNRGGEYISQEFKDYLKACGIIQQLTPPYTPQHKGVSERRNRTLLNMVRSMMNLTTLLLSFWDYALESATSILSMVPTKKVDKTPYELWYGKVPNLSYLKVWGCEAFVKRDMPDKLQQRSVKCIFIGYPKETMGYYFNFLPENKIVVARYAEFFEKNLITQEVSGRAIDLEEIQDEDTLPSKITGEIPMEVEGFEPPQEEVILVRRYERTHRAPTRLCLNVDVEENSLGDLNEPASYKAVMLDSESNKWLDAMNAEMQSMKDNQKCSYPDVRAIRILIFIAAFYDYEIWQMDIKTSFLNGYLDEDIYMVQPEGFVDPNHPRKASGSNVTFVILYVDDITIMGNHIPSLQIVKDYLGKCFAMKDLGEAAFILGIKIYRDRNPEAELIVDCYCNAGFEIDIDDMKSQTEYVFILNGRRSRLEKLKVKYYCKACYIS
nr:hypothetical protein [Tanacetum cinerariifolium]